MDDSDGLTDIGAAAVARRAMEAVQGGQRNDWLDLFADDATLEDPVGAVPGLRGKEAIAGFWDAGIEGLENVRFDVRRTHEAPREVVVLADISITAPGGASARYDAAIHYTVDDSGDITSLRAFWDLPDVVTQLAA